MAARAAVILAAGQGTRMRSPLPKVLHLLAGRAMLDHAIDTAEALGCERIVVVVGTHAPEVGRHVEARLGPEAVAVQDPPLGTGHAVRCAEVAQPGGCQHGRKTRAISVDLREEAAKRQGFSCVQAA